MVFYSLFEVLWTRDKPWKNYRPVFIYDEWEVGSLESYKNYLLGEVEFGDPIVWKFQVIA